MSNFRMDFWNDSGEEYATAFSGYSIVSAKDPTQIIQHTTYPYIEDH